MAGYLDELKKLNTDMMNKDRDPDKSSSATELFTLAADPAETKPAAGRRRPPCRRSISRRSTPPSARLKASAKGL